MKLSRAIFLATCLLLATLLLSAEARKVEVQEKNSKSTKTAEKEEVEKEKEAVPVKADKKEKTDEKKVKEEKVKEPKQEKTKEVKEEKVKETKEEKVKETKEEKVKETKEEKVKEPKQEKPAKEAKPEKAPKIEIPRNTTEEAISKVGKHVFWDGIANSTFLLNQKLQGQKKSSCTPNAFNKLNVTSQPRNLCLENAFNATLDGQWVQWTNASTAEVGQYRFSQNGTACEQQLNWNISEVNGTEIIGSEAGLFKYTNSSAGITVECQISGKQNVSASQSEWTANTNYSVLISGDKRGEVLNKTSKITTNANDTNTQIHETNEFVEDTLELLNAVNKTSKKENKINSGFNFVSNTVNGNTTIALKQWIKSKELVDYVETTVEGQIFGNQHSKVKNETSDVTYQGITLQSTGIVQNRSRTYVKSTFGPSAGAVNYTDAGYDEKWKINTVKPEKNVKTPPTVWNVNGTYVEPVVVDIPTLHADKKSSKKNSPKLDL